MNKEVEPSLFSLWPASSSGPLFSLFFFFFLAVNLLKRIEDEEETCFVFFCFFLFFKKGRTAMATSHASTLPFTGSLYTEQVQIISGTSKNILEKEHVLCNRFNEISLTLISRFGSVMQFVI